MSLVGPKPNPAPAASRLVRVACYAWAAPTSLVGLVVGLLTLATRGRVRCVAGVLEFHGGLSRWLLERTPIGAQALALGHVIVGRDLESLDRCRRHERVHVRQAERWGPAFLPAYLASSAWAWLRGLDPYYANHFERQAYREANGCDSLGFVRASRRRGASAGGPVRGQPERRSDHRA
ncbi:MAG: hypothetical protein KatS3mg108_1314 [Isosphaeraceae bacterium]|nr:MAG: hypothetical protein KatS3mg108_1314 [Isosphaeraceae bacterium]